MPHLSAPTVVVSGTKILASKYNADISGLVTGVNASCQFLDVAATNTVANTWSALQTMTGGLTLSGSSNLSVAGTSTLTGNVTAAGTLAVTGNTTVGGTLVVTGAITGNLTGNVTGNVTGNLTGNVTGNTSGSSGSCTGNAATATALATGRAINGVTFDGTAPITVTAAAGTLSGATLASGVTASSLTTFGTLAGNLIFTDNTYDIGASGATRPRSLYAGTSVVTPLLNNSGSTITLRGVTYTLPSADGSAGQVLQTNGSAVLTWAAASSGFVTGTGTTGKLAKWGSSSGLADSIFSEASTVGTVTGTLVVTGASVTIGTTPATSGVIRLPNNTIIAARNGANSANATLLTLNAFDQLLLGTSNVASVLIGPASLRFPISDGSTGQFISTDGSGTLTFATAGGVSGLTTGKLPKAGSSTTLVDSLVSESGSTVTVTGILSVSSNATVGGTLGVTGAAALSSTLAVTGISTLTGNVSMGGTLTVTGLVTASGNCLVSGTFTVGGNTSLNGDTTLGDASSDTVTFTARVGSTIAAQTDATHDLGASSHQFRDLLISRKVAIGGVQVVGAQDTGWTTDWTGSPGPSKSQAIPQFNQAPATLADAARAIDVIKLSETLNALYNALTTHGLIGA